MDKFINSITPKKINSKKIRVGPNEDGGYVISECMLDNCSCLFTYGVGNETRFEQDFVKKYKKQVYMFDHTINKNSYKDEYVNFFNEGLGFEKNCDTFINHYNKLNIEGAVLLKIDIEGSEYDFFEKTDILELSNIVTGICIEVHSLNSENYRNRFIEIFNRLNEYFVLVHVHGNNWGGTFTYDDYQIPAIMELTFVNRQIAKNIEECNEKYPIKNLDYANTMLYPPDLELSYINKNREFAVSHYSPSTEKNMTTDIINAGVGDYPTQNIKTIPVYKNYINPRFYPRKLGDNPDTFSVKYNGDSITVQRTDCNLSWGQPLLIDVEFDLHEPIKSNKKTLIPKVIYQTYKDYNVPNGMREAINSWRNNNPDYEHYFYSDKDCIDFIEKNFEPNVLDAYLALIPGAFKADLWRCCILYIKGGVYVDSDMICLNSLNEFIDEDDTFISARDDPMSKSFIYNAFMASVPHHAFIKQQIDSIVDNANKKRQCYYLDIAGPGLLGKSINKVCRREENSEFNLGKSNLNGFDLKLLEHNWPSRTVRLNNKDLILDEYPQKNNEMKKLKIPTYYDLYQKNIVYQQIPRNIYFTTRDYQGINNYMINSFKEKNKYWKINHFLDEDVLDFFKKNNDQFKKLLNVDVLEKYLSFANGGEKADFWRYCVIYLFGGLYTDADTYCNIKIDDWISHYDLILGLECFLNKKQAEELGIENVLYKNNKDYICFCNWTFAAAPKHELFKNIIIDICNNPIKNNVLVNTGPGRITKHVIDYFGQENISKLKFQNIEKNHSIIFSINKFGSNQAHSNAYKNYNDPFLVEGVEDVYIIHKFEGSWRKNSNKNLININLSHNTVANMAIRQTDEGYLGIARYDKDTTRTEFMKKIGDCRSLVEVNFDKNFNVLSEKEVNIIGYNENAKFEDPRFFKFLDKDYIIISYLDEKFNCKMGVLDVDYNYLGDIKIDEYNYVSWQGRDVVWEKNWLFFEHKKQLYFIYSTTPRFVIYKCTDFESLNFEKHIDIEWPLNEDVPKQEVYFTGFIGSNRRVATGGSCSPLYIKEKDLFVYLIHTKLYSKRKYNHYAVILDGNLMPVKLVKEPIITENVPYVHMFITTMISDGNYFILSGGIDDRSNFIWELSKNQILSLCGIQ